MNEILDQRDPRRTHPGTAAAGDAILEPEIDRIGQRIIADACRHLQRQQPHRAGLDAAATADARIGFGIGRFVAVEQQDAAGALDHRNLHVWQAHAHHRAAHHQLCGLAAGAAGKGHQLADQGTQHHFVVTRCGRGGTVQGHQAAHQRPPEAHRLLYRVGGADVVHDHPHVGGARIGRHLATGQFDDELSVRTHRIARRHRHHLDFRVAGGRRTHRGDCRRLVVLDADPRLLRTGRDQHQADAGDDVVGTVAHQPLVA